MAVHTELSADQLAAALARFGLPPPLRSRGIPEGSINTLYEVEVGQGRFVLRLSEGRADAEVEFEVGLCDHLAGAGFPCARPRPTKEGHLWTKVVHRQACLFPWLPGEAIGRADVTPERCERVGALLARMHVLAEPYPRTLANRYAPERILPWAEELARAQDEEVRAAAPAWAEEARAQRPALPLGTIHADLFVDNVLWLGEQVSAVLDFEMACTDALALDLATALCAWCYGDRFLRARAAALVRGYQSRRKLTHGEREGLYGLTRFAAARYAVTRVRDFHLSKLAADRLVKKDWRRYRDRLLELRAMGPRGFAQFVF